MMTQRKRRVTRVTESGKGKREERAVGRGGGEPKGMKKFKKDTN